MKSLRALRMHSNAERNAKTLQKCRRFVNSAFNGIGDDCARAQLDHWPVQFPCLVVASFCSSAHTHTQRDVSSATLETHATTSMALTTRLLLDRRARHPLVQKHISVFCADPSVLRGSSAAQHLHVYTSGLRALHASPMVVAQIVARIW